jgi:hypothetical protein
LPPDYESPEIILELLIAFEKLVQGSFAKDGDLTGVAAPSETV